MSTPSNKAGLRISSPVESMQISLTDSTFNEVANGSGELIQDDLAPGIYELRLSAGSATDTRLVSLRPGQRLVETVELSFPAAVPLPGTTTWDASHQLAATRASEHIVHSQCAESSGGLLVMARATQELNASISPLEFELTRGSTVIRAEDRPWWRGVGSDWLVRAGAVEPGAYGLRTRTEDSSTDQSLWVTKGWQTLVFVPVGRQGLVPSRASVLMFPMDLPWNPALSRRSAQATELALAGLRERRSVLPSDLLDLLLYEKFRDPMLGLIAAHSMLLEPKVDLRRLEVVLGNLDRLMPIAPDVLALRALGEEAGVKIEGRPGQQVHERAPLHWPPMLLLGYTALIRSDARSGGKEIAVGSPAQTVADRLTGEGVWTSWTVQEHAPMQKRRGRSRLRPQRRDSSVADSLRTIDVTGPAAQRVADYLAVVADAETPPSLDAMLEGNLGDLVSVSAATSVPLRVVESTISKLKDSLE